MKRHLIPILTSAVIVSVVLSSFLYQFFAPYWQISSYHVGLQRWQQSQPRHYTYESTWQDVKKYQRHWQIEIQDGQLVQARDLITGQSPNPNELVYAERFIFIDNLFVRINESLFPQSSIGGYVGRAYPGLIQFLATHSLPIPEDWVCVTPLPKVRYNTQWGYPGYVEYETSPCAVTNFYQTKVAVTISNFQPLP